MRNFKGLTFEMCSGSGSDLWSACWRTDGLGEKGVSSTSLRRTKQRNKPVFYMLCGYIIGFWLSILRKTNWRCAEGLRLGRYAQACGTE